MEIVNGAKIITPFSEGLRQIANKHGLSFAKLDSLMQTMTPDMEESFLSLSMEKKEEVLLEGINQLKSPK